VYWGQMVESIFCVYKLAHNDYSLVVFGQ